MTGSRLWPFVLAALVVAGCRNPPPRPWLRFEPTDLGGFTRTEDGRLRAGCGPTVCWFDLSRNEATIKLEVENPSGKPVDLRVGPDGGNASAAIGEVLVRPIGPGNREVGTRNAVPYLAQQDFRLPNACKAEFYLDKPLGQDVDIGQFMVFRIISIDPETGARDQRTLQLIATNAGGQAGQGSVRQR